MDDGIDLKAPDGCISIDADESDLKALRCAREALVGAPRHHCTREAVASLLRCSETVGASRQANLVGHGVSGWMGAGSGRMRGNDPQKYLGIDNETTWEPLVATLKGRFDSLVLWACDVGAGAEGATLLHKLAEATQARVAAPVDTLRCNGPKEFSVDNYSGWQIAAPNEPSPRAKEPLMEVFRAGPAEPERAEWDRPSDWESLFVPLNRIGEAHVLWADIDTVECYDASSSEPVKILQFGDKGRQIFALAKLLHFDSWLWAQMPFLAMQTGKLIFNYSSFNTAHRVQLDIYSDRFVHDAREPDSRMYYRTVPHLLGRLMTL